ncbi:resolvase [Adhaeribacter arboris]|uniref:Resolvase n=1 Tax=Adhaeribacter arboris TaxID=2072846 RepID=A0A2T2YEI4_9BACT|nr:recombinase family protein [Adhaeribacter arboris]PSR53917.1 resolvase [Adhaeribacter arboris]
MKVAIYARVSTKQHQTTENQLLELRRWTQAMGHTIYKEYQEQVSGGRSDRSEFKQMFTDAHQRKFDLVFFWSLDRFSREGVSQTILYLAQLESYGVQFKSFTEQYLDSTGIFKEMIISLLATLAKQEKLRQSERVKAGLERVAAKGIKLGRPGVSSELLNQIPLLVKEGLSDRAIGKKLEISHQSVIRWKAKHPIS